MIISYEEGDLLEMFKQDRFTAIVHGCNCFNAMGKGIALQIKEQFPQAYEADQRTNRGDRSKLGNMSLAVTEYGIIFNAYTQYTFWDEKDMLYYEAVESCFKRIEGYYNEVWPHMVAGEIEYYGRSKPTLGIPLIGCGLAKGKWEYIEEIINLTTRLVDVVVVTLPKQNKIEQHVYLK